MRPYLIAAFILITASAQAQDAAAILRRHEKVMGDARQWAGLKTVQVKGQQGRGVRMVYTIAQGKGIKIDLGYSGIINHQAAVAPGNGWVRFLSWPHGADSIQLSAMHVYWPFFDLRASLLLNTTASGTKAEYLGTETMNDVYCYKLRCTDADGQASICYMDTATCYLVMTERTVLVKDEERDAAISYSNYKQVNGMMIPMSYTTNNGTQTIEHIELNVAVNDTTFTPAAPDKN